MTKHGKLVRKFLSPIMKIDFEIRCIENVKTFYQLNALPFVVILFPKMARDALF